MPSPASIAIWTLGWSLIGFTLGYLVGETVHRVAASEGTHDMPEETPPRRFNPRVLVGIVLVALGVLTAVQGIVTSSQVRELQACQINYANQFADALDARSRASEQAQHALDDLVRITGETQDPNRVHLAVQAYLQQRQQTIADRQANPLPEAPRQMCAR